IGKVRLAQPVDLTRRADAFDRGIEPQRQHHAWISRRSARLALTRFDLGVQRSEIEREHERPYHPRQMIGWKPSLEINQIPRQLRPARFYHPCSACHRTLRANLSAQNESQRTVTRLHHRRIFHRLEGGDPYAAARRVAGRAIAETLVVMGPRLRGDDSGWV